MFVTSLGRLAALLVLCSLLALAGCGDDTLDVDLTGTWRGTIARGHGNVPSDREPYTLTLVQRDRTLTGTLCRDEAKRCNDLESGTIKTSSDENRASTIALRTLQPPSDAPLEAPPGPYSMILDLDIRRTTEPVSLLSGSSFVQRGSVTDMLATSFVREAGAPSP